MTPIASIPTDLLTPLGAYLRLRAAGTSSFLLESVEQGRLGRYSFIGAGTRVVSLAEAESEPAPVVGYVGYDHAAVLEPSVPLPAEGDGLPESGFVVADVLVRYDHGRGVAEVLHGDPDEVRGRLEAGESWVRHERGPAGPVVREPSAAIYRRSVRRAQERMTHAMGAGVGGAHTLGLGARRRRPCRRAAAAGSAARTHRGR